jgi:hypothetical protein
MPVKEKEMSVLETPEQQKQIDDSIANMSINEMHSRIYTLRKMMTDERLCRRMMVTQQPQNWAKIQHSSFKELKNVCGICINAMNQAIEQRLDGQEASGNDHA